MVFDNGAVNFWEYTSKKVQEYSERKERKFHLFAENDTNGLRHIKPLEEGGFGFDQDGSTIFTMLYMCCSIGKVRNTMQILVK